MMPSSFRRWIWMGLVAAMAACDTGGPPGLGRDVRRDLERGRAIAARWILQGRDVQETPADVTLALSYLERHRLGLGSPFRLIDIAMADPRFVPDLRRDVSWALLARTLDGDGYEIDYAALDRAAPAAAGGAWSGAGALHLELIRGAIKQASDPRAGELAIRLAYALAAAEGTVDSRAPELAARTAALLRDREMARTDALQLLRTAQAMDADPLALVGRWRAERRFSVETPALAALSPEAELTALELAPRLARGVRDLELRVASGAGIATQPVASLLGPPAARRLAALADSFNMPPQAPIAVAVATHRRDLVGGGALGELARTRRERFIRSSVTEERFAAEYALVLDGAPGAAPAATALAAAVAMRAYAQEPVWFPGLPAPSTRDLQERYGLADVRFGKDVPTAWRPYYRRMIDLALADLRRVLPALDLRGLVLAIDGGGRLRGTTLALHDPRTRRVILPPASAAGTIAHEIAHDLDWQVALRRYRVRGDYASDRAARLPNDRLAMRMQELAAASLDPGEAENGSGHARRPAEIFARNVDWFVAVSLAADGRSNGYLTSIQDDLLTGYGTARSPDITGTSGETLVTILDEVAPLYPATRDWFLKSYGLNRALTPYDLARRVLQAPEGKSAGEEFEGPLAPVTMAAMRLGPVQVAREAGFAAIDAWLCRAPGAAYNPRLESARRNLVIEAAAARARGSALAYAYSVGTEAGRRRVARALYGPAWPDATVDSAIADILAPLPAIAAALVGGSAPDSAPRIDLFAPPGRCAAAPFRLTADN
jgi:hypothetical protein